MELAHAIESLRGVALHVVGVVALLPVVCVGMTLLAQWRFNEAGDR